MADFTLGWLSRSQCRGHDAVSQRSLRPMGLSAQALPYRSPRARRRQTSAPVRRVFAVAAALMMLPLASSPSARAQTLNPYSHCGTERWHIKTLDDSDASKITDPPTTGTVEGLRALSVPSGYSSRNDTHRYPPTEDTKYAVSAILVGFKQEADRDFHVVISDPSSGNTMIAEIPDPQCSTVKASGHADQIAAVRQSFVACFGPPLASGKFENFPQRMLVQITGVAFFDVLHGQTGVAPNGIELHPVLAIKTLSGSCPTGYTARS